MMKWNAILIVLLALVPSAIAADSAQVLIVVGPSQHPPGTHEVAAGGRLLEHCLEHMENVSGVNAHVIESWPDKSLRDQATTIVFIGDLFPPNRFPHPEQNLAELNEMMQRGVGIVCIHYATGLLGKDVKPDGEHPLLHWLGGYFANRSCPHHQSIAKIFPAATITPAASTHPISRGWKEFTLHDEPYINNYFGAKENALSSQVTVLATSMLPPEAPRKETVAWGIERPDGGRGFGIVMPHFYRNWRNEDLRRCILNGVIWSAHLEVPEEGVMTGTPELSEFHPASVEWNAPVKKPKQ